MGIKVKVFLDVDVRVTVTDKLGPIVINMATTQGSEQLLSILKDIGMRKMNLELSPGVRLESKMEGLTKHEVIEKLRAEGVDVTCYDKD